MFERNLVACQCRLSCQAYSHNNSSDIYDAIAFTILYPENIWRFSVKFRKKGVNILHLQTVQSLWTLAAISFWIFCSRKYIKTYCKDLHTFFNKLSLKGFISVSGKRSYEFISASFFFFFRVYLLLHHSDCCFFFSQITVFFLRFHTQCLLQCFLTVWCFILINLKLLLFPKMEKQEYIFIKIHTWLC